MAQHSIKEFLSEARENPQEYAVRIDHLKRAAKQFLGDHYSQRLNGFLQTIFPDWKPEKSLPDPGARLRIAKIQEDSAQLIKYLLKTIALYHAQRDHLTELQRRGSEFTQEFDRRIEMAQENGSNLAVLLLDLDHFKLINDSHGHPAGDEILRELGVLLRTNLRTEDAVIARYGGEEFIVVISGCNEEECEIIAERLRKVIASHRFSFEDTEIPVTISIGVVNLTDVSEPTQAGLITAADQGLYEAKRTGRDRVVVFRRKTPLLRESEAHKIAA